MKAINIREFGAPEVLELVEVADPEVRPDDLLVHAILHLAGYDHEADADAETMEDAERSILASLGIPDPYREH